MGHRWTKPGTDGNQYAGLCICGKPRRPVHHPINQRPVFAERKVEANLARANGPVPWFITMLLTQAEPADDLLIPGAVFARQVLEELVAAADELE
jgi:hypothetical protein